MHMEIKKAEDSQGNIKLQSWETYSKIYQDIIKEQSIRQFHIGSRKEKCIRGGRKEYGESGEAFGRKKKKAPGHHSGNLWETLCFSHIGLASNQNRPVDGYVYFLPIFPAIIL